MKIKLAFLIFMLAGLLLGACSALSGTTGTLEGKVTIGPVTPVEKAGATPALPRPEAFTSRGIEILMSGTETVYKTVHFNADGTYSTSLPEGEYIIRLIPGGIDHAEGIPAIVKITAGEVMTLDINIDTGIR